MPNTAPRRLLPTTRTQVSGHRFMRRRMEHGLVFGDIRMIHDPLASRRRATIFGGVAVALIAACMALFAWLRPNADPGDASILRSQGGELFVRVEDTVHPVTNLTSARLITGKPDQPQRIGDENLVGLPRGVPVGIVTAPSVFAPAESADLSWSACASPDAVTVIADAAAMPLTPATAVLASSGGQEWVVTNSGRALLPDGNDPQGRIIRRALGVDSSTPRWNPPAQLLSAVAERPVLAVPQPLPEVIVTESESWVQVPSGEIQPITDLQREIISDAGAHQRELTASELAKYPDANPVITIPLPERAPEWIDPATTTVCVNENGVGSTISAPFPFSLVELSGVSVADYFGGLADGAVAVETDHGFHVVSTTGMRHAVEAAPVFDTIGAQHTEHVPWEIIALLPEGSALTQREALKATY